MGWRDEPAGECYTFCCTLNGLEKGESYEAYKCRWAFWNGEIIHAVAAIKRDMGYDRIGTMGWIARFSICTAFGTFDNDVDEMVWDGTRWSALA